MNLQAPQPATQPKSVLAKLVIVQPLADHDGAAIYAFEIVSFNKTTGTLINKMRIYPDLTEQVEEPFGRSLNHAMLHQVMAGLTPQSYLLKRGEPSQNLNEVPAMLAQELFRPGVGADAQCEYFFWQMAKSYPVLRQFYVQASEEVSELFELPEPIDARSFVGKKCIARLDEETDVYALTNAIAQKYMPVIIPSVQELSI